MSNSNIAVIGAGHAGLCAAKESLQSGFSVTVYERNEAVGGTWLYTDETGKDRYGLDIHTAMYKNLRTNIPIQWMAFSDFPYPSGVRSYPLYTEVLKYLESYADHFNLKRHIKFNHNVIRVAPIENEKWEIIVKDLVNNTFETKIYDVVLIGNGHFSVPNIPEIPGASEFKGKMFHSHDFRDAEHYRGDRILIIGGGPSGKDLTAHCSNTAERITWSQRKIPNESKEAHERRKSLLPAKVTLREDVKRFTITGAEFSDGSHETFSVVIFATGYHFKFPFLTDDCGIFIEDDYIQPLYKHIINIEHSTMAFIGITIFHELEVKFALKFMSGAKKLPTKREMMADMQTQYQILWNKGIPKRKMHALFTPELCQNYLEQLSDAADMEKCPEVSNSIYKDGILTLIRDPNGYRNYNYVIIDDKTFTKEICED